MGCCRLGHETDADRDARMEREREQQARSIKAKLDTLNAAKAAKAKQLRRSQP